MSFAGQELIRAGDAVGAIEVLEARLRAQRSEPTVAQGLWRMPMAARVKSAPH